MHRYVNSVKMKPVLMFVEVEKRKVQIINGLYIETYTREMTKTGFYMKRKRVDSLSEKFVLLIGCQGKELRTT